MLMIYLTSVNENRMNPDAGTLDQLLARVSGKDSEALASLYHSTRVSVYSLAFSILKNAHDAEDVLHDCFVNIFSAAGNYRSNGKPMAWILTIARNLCLRKLRDGRKRELLPEEDWEQFLDEHQEIPAEDRLLVSQWMTLLSDEERQIITLHAVSGFKHREIAGLLSLPLPTVLSKYNRALKKLRKTCEKES